MKFKNKITTLCTGVLILGALALPSTALATESTLEDEAVVSTQEEVLPVEEEVLAEESTEEAVETPAVEEVAPAITDKKKPPSFKKYEVCATWRVDQGAELWPQTLVSRDCAYVPVQECSPYKIQFDRYWIRDAEDEAYWLSLTGLSSPADDARLDPHAYYVKTIDALSKKDCTPKPPVDNGSDSSETPAVCVSPLDGTATSTTETVSWTRDWVWSDSGATWIPGETIYSDPVITTNTFPSEDCTPPVVVPPTEPPVTTPPTTPPTQEPPAEIAEGEEFLAETGASGEEIAAIAAGAFALIALSIYLITRRKKNSVE